MLFLESIDDLGLDVQVNSAAYRKLKLLASAEDVADVLVNNGNLMPLQMCTNPGFETNTTSWGFGTNCTIARSTVQKRTGTASLLFTRSNATAGNAFASYAWTGLTIGQRYTFEAWIRQSSGAVTVDCSIGNVFYTNAVTTSTTWQKIYRTFVAAATSYTCYVRQEAGAAGNAWYLDDVYLYRAPLYVSLRSPEDYGDLATSTSALTITNLRTNLSAATLDSVDVQMGGELTVLPAVVLAGTGDAEMDMSGTLTVTETDWLDGSIDVDVVPTLEFILIGYFLSNADPMDMDLDMEATRVANTFYPLGIAWDVSLVPARGILYLVIPNDTPITQDRTMAMEVLQVRSGASMRMQRIRKVTLPPAPEPAVGGDPPAAGGVIVRALYGVVVDMDVPTITDGIPK